MIKANVVVVLILCIMLSGEFIETHYYKKSIHITNLLTYIYNPYTRYSSTLLMISLHITEHRPPISEGVPSKPTLIYIVIVKAAILN